jgi:type II secretory pathway component PulF
MRPGVAVVFVLPKFADFYGRFEADLPLPTVIMIEFNNLIQNHGVVTAIVLVLVVLLTVYGLRTQKGREIWDMIKLMIPVIGPLSLKIAISKFAKMLGTLDRCGIPILRNLEVVADTVDNILIAKEIMRQRESVKAGKSLAEPIRESKYFPPLVSEMLAVGEATGSVEQVLNAVSEHYDREIKYTIKNMTTMIEPIITIVMGVFVLFMAVAVFLPMWKMSQIVRK